MKKSIFALSLLTALLASTAVSAAEESLTFNAGVTSDYRYRGISQTRLKPAIQAGVDYANVAGSGFYIGAWGSTIKWIKDAGGNGPSELDVYAGHKGKLNRDLSYDVGYLRYQYHNHGLSPSPNTDEVYAALTHGPVTIKYSHAFSNLFGLPGSKHSDYLDISASVDVYNGWTVTPHVGRQWIQNYSNLSYTDYSLSVSKDFNGFVPSIGVVSTNTNNFTSPSGKNLGKTGVVASVKYNF